MPVRKGWLLGGLVAMTMALWPGAHAARSHAQLPETVLTGVHLFDGTGAALRSDVDIFIAEGVIAAIVGTGTRPIAAGARVAELQGKWVIPGLIDGHVHYDSWMADLFLYHGVTSVFDLGNDTDAILVRRDALRSGGTRGPRLFATGMALEGPAPDGHSKSQRPERQVHSAAEARARALERLDRGVDAIKVHEWMPAAWIREVAAVAHARGKPVVGHLSTPVHAAVEAGLDGLIHPYTVDLSTLADQRKLAFINENMPRYAERVEYYPFHLLEPDRYAPLVDQMVRAGTFFNPTFGAQFRGVYAERDEFERYDSMFVDAHVRELSYLMRPLKEKLLPFFTRVRFYDVNPELHDQLEAGMENVAELMRQFSKAGGRMVAGTDTSRIGIPGIRLHRELQLWVSRGISPVETLRAATQYPAQLFRLADLGTLEPGKRADLVVLQGNPLEDMRFLGAIDRVMQNGRFVPRQLDAGSLSGLLKDGS